MTEKINSRIPGLDLLRAAAIVLVLAAHYPKTANGLVSRALNFGWIGVDLFFVLSGYLIGGQLLKPYLRDGSADFGRFYLRRLLRTLPNYYVVLGAYYALSASGALPGPSPSWTYLAFGQNFTSLSTFAPSWSLCVEEQFYLFFPVVLWLLFKTRNRTIAIWSIPTLLAAEVVIRAVIWSVVRPDQLPEPDALNAYMKFLYNPTYSRMDGILLGVGVAAIQYGSPGIWRQLRQRNSALLSLAGVALVAGMGVFWKRYTLPGAAIGFTLLAMCFALLTFVSLNTSSILGRCSVPGARWVALRSYALYLTHSLAIAAGAGLLQRIHTPLDSFKGIALIGVLAILFAETLYRAIERPALACRECLGRPHPSVPSQVPDFVGADL